ncbi:peptidase family M49-domain-containing protein [Aspergillus caelatus]|uniref:Peptidase family M49-domain-containing protein n=1 Tax=Aspergillus caelatus TaxID=61420 RepID=A0A5N7A380_9EURO|nr:peptidase family M49-domain-containing protein [Aspergillus caelatus]KAE8364282.1 peptidase family M49-domain-containing protein [Aspergillus caelatus]
MAVPPFSLGYPGKDARSAYYPSEEPISPDEIAKVSDAMKRYCIGPENTRVEKLVKDGSRMIQLPKQAWGQVYHQAHFSTFKHLLTVYVDRIKILSHGKPALGRYLCHLHIWGCPADSSSCKDLYEPMCAVEGVYEEWRQILCSKPKPRWKIVQPNTVVKGEDLELRVYEESNEGIIQSWDERGS